MNHGTYIFTQVIAHLLRPPFAMSVKKYKGEQYTKCLSCYDQLLVIMFGQLSYHDSLRDIVACLNVYQRKLYHLGFRTLPKLHTLVKANEKRDWKIYRDLCNTLTGETRLFYAGDADIATNITASCYAIDSSSIDLRLSLFPSLPYVKTKGAVKLHLQLDLCDSIPAFFNMTSGKVYDTTFLDSVVYEAESFYILNRGYIDFVRLHRIHTSGTFFVTRAKINTKFNRRYSRNTNSAITCDQVGTLNNTKYRDTLQCIKYTDEAGHVYVFFINNMSVSVESIALLYKNRWQIELFFKWIKQHLKIKQFWGHSENALKMQICIAMCTYL